MKQKPASLRRTVGLLLAAAALPLNPALAQDTTTVTTTTTQPPVVDITPPPAPAAPAPVIQPPAPAPVATAPAPAASAPEPADTSASTAASNGSRAASTRRAAPVRTAARAAPARSAPVETRAPAPAPTAEAPPPPAPTTAPLAATPPGSPATAPAPAPQATPAPAQPAQPARGSIWPWLVGALVLIGAAALLMRRRRRDDEIYYEEEVAREPEVVAAPIIAPPMAESVAPVATMAPALAEETGRPQIALAMRPVRAGVNEADAVVEFELTVDNRGNAPARDVRISTWMFPAGQASEAERHLIQPAEEAELPAVTIDSGHAKKIESAVALPTSGLEEDAVLPVVVAEAHYRLPDGSEAQTRASFEVGVPVGDELAHFALDNPSGMHDDVVARPHRESLDA